jgi:hypothetical protein
VLAPLPFPCPFPLPLAPKHPFELPNAFELEEGVLVIRRVYVAMHLMTAEENRSVVERAHAIYAMRCPLYRTLHKAIQLTSSFDLVTPSD